MGTNIIARGLNGGGRFRIAFQRQRAAKNRNGQIAFLEQAMQAPKTNATAIFKHTLGCQIAA